MADRVYIIEDDAALSGELARLLQLNGYEVEVCNDFTNAAEDAMSCNPACILLDLMLPGTDGQSICRDIRKLSDVPIIVLTSAADEFTEVMCLNLGAHDFVKKPYHPASLLARIAALIKRHSQASEASSTLSHSGVSLDLNASEVSYGNKTTQITRNEQRMLSMLMRNPGTIVSRQDLMCDLWESDAFVDDNTLTVNVNRLRKTLSRIGVPDSFLQTRRAQGYVVAK